MKEIFSFFINKYKFTFSLTVFVIAFGLLGLYRLQRESFPNVDFARAIVTTQYPGSSPEEVEEKITRKLEEEIRTVDGVKDVRSVSQSGKSEITIRVELEGFDIDQVMSDLQSAVQRVSDLPDGILEDPKFLRLNSKELPVIKLAIAGPSEGRIRDVLADRLKDILEDDKQVSKVELVGYREREFQIFLNPEKMRNYHIGIDEVVLAVNKRSQNIPAGYIRSFAEEMLVRVQGQIKSVEEMADIVIRSNFNGRKVKIRDVATVLDGAEEPNMKARLNGLPATLVIVNKKANADSIKTVEALEKRIATFKENLPKEYEVIVYHDESETVKDRLAIVINNAVSGLLIVFFVLFLFLPGSLGAVASLSLPLSIMATVGMLPAIGATFNTISMLALVIAIGMLVDNSVVVSENYARLRKLGVPLKDAPLKAAHQFWIPITGTVMTTVASFLPMLVTKGIMGDFIRFIPIIVSIALGMSLFESFFLLPARLQFTVKKDSYKHSRFNFGIWFENFMPKFEDFLKVAIKWRYLVIFLLGFSLLASFMLSYFGNRFELFPAEDVERYYAKFELAETGTLEDIDQEAEKLVQKVKKVLNKDIIRYQITHAGEGNAGLKDMHKKAAHNVGTLLISVPRTKARKLKTQDMLKRLRTIDKGRFASLTFEADVNGPPVGKPITITLRSNNEKELHELAIELEEELSKIKGVMEIADDIEVGKPEYLIELNYEMLARLKLSTHAVGVALRTALQGTIASELNMDNDEFNLRVRYGDDQRETIEALKNTKIMEPSGSLIPLTALATITENTGPSIKRHLDYQRAVTITGDVVPEVITSIRANQIAMELYKKRSHKYPGVTIRFGGEQESTKESLESLANAMILAILGIFMILILLFDSIIKPFIILSSIPLGLIGVNIAFFLHQKPIGFLALIGVVGLAGVVVNSAIVLISYIDDLTREEKKLSRHEILAKASSNRLRAVLVTSLTTVAGLMPTAYSIGGHDGILVPMTLALAWGLAGGTLLTLIWIPCSLAALDDIFSFLKRGKSKA